MRKGFTLIEILMSVAIFSVIVTVLVSLFASAFKHQQESMASAYLLNNTSYITEYISRALRMAKKDLTAACIPQNRNYELVGGDEHIRFLNDDDECQEFFLDGNILKVDKPNKPGDPPELTPSNIIVERLKFVISGEPQDDNEQPKVTFSLKLTYQEQVLEFQTTISQRDLDVQY